MIENAESIESNSEKVNKDRWRHSMQPLLKQKIDAGEAAPGYVHFPYHPLGEGKIFSGWDELVDWIIREQTVIIDGYAGVFYEHILEELDMVLMTRGKSVCWQLTGAHLKPEEEVNALVKPFLGGNEEVWGTKTTLGLADFYRETLGAINPDASAEINIVIGPGAALCGWKAPVVYFDLPKNELQYRMRAAAVTNLGMGEAEAPFNMYKRFYFIDWVVLDKHRNAIMDRVAIVADGQWHDGLNWMYKDDLLEGLKLLSHSVFRVRPWFEKGSWGGQWMKRHLPGINLDEVNYAWSFELITPENGLIFESDGNLLEVSFDFLMLFEYKAVLGKHATLFGPYFPIRFDFLDTFDGGNLSIQCHPSKKYIREKFGETITQDETYYILDCEPGAVVYLGFQEDIEPKAFRDALEFSQANNKPLDVERYVQRFPAHKHDLFLIPNGTVHSSGKNNMVLEISATPYIFTFKMYDWLSLDLNGNPRPINIEHAFNNLRFERKGAVVEREHLSRPVVVERGTDWELVHLPTHREHFYDVERIEFDSEVLVDTNDACHVLMLVEGTAIVVEVRGYAPQKFNYAETFIVPAAAKSYKLINLGTGRAKVIRSFVKEDYPI